ncbi:MAG TPA: hydrogenase maturation protease [Kofleriaceae bacterium]|nr:hydrogenase maturation protease [Kofleriaceae bacterium]
MTAVVVGIGQAAAGDDGVGLVVAEALAARGFETRQAADASVLLPLLEAARRVVLVDAVVGGGAPGSVSRLAPAQLASGPTPLSSHGLGVAEALELARTLYGEAAGSRVDIVGVAIARPSGPAFGLSAEVAAAVEPAAALAAMLAGG